MSESRRKVLTAGAAAIPQALVEASGLAGLPAIDGPAGGEGEVCERPPRVRGRNADYFPNLVFTTHDYQRVLFYDDLLMGGQRVLINCMSIAGDKTYPVTENLARVQPYLGESLGRDVFMYSLSTDPRDTPEALAAFARKYGARPGWFFLTGKSDDVDLLRGRLFTHNGARGNSHGGHGEHAGDSAHAGPFADKDCSVGLCRYGNESIGLWGSCPAVANPEWIAKRLSWVEVKEPHAGPHRRGGPHPHTWRS